MRCNRGRWSGMEVLVLEVEQIWKLDDGDYQKHKNYDLECFIDN